MFYLDRMMHPKKPQENWNRFEKSHMGIHNVYIEMMMRRTIRKKKSEKMEIEVFVGDDRKLEGIIKFYIENNR